MPPHQGGDLLVFMPTLSQRKYRKIPAKNQQKKAFWNKIFEVSMKENKNKKVQHELPNIAEINGRLVIQKISWVKEYKHYKTGKLMRAEDYGYKAWPFRRK